MRRESDSSFPAGIVALACGAALATAGAATAAVEIATLVTGLSAPIAYVDPPDHLPHRFIAQQRGDVVVWDGNAGTPLATPFLDIRGDNAALPAGQRKVTFSGERGLLAMAFHPDYASNGYFYLYYTSTDWDGAGGINLGDIVIERYTRDPMNPNVAQPGSAQIVLVIPHSSQANHNGGDLRFGSDGYLYVAVGDGGGGCDSAAHSGQDVNQLLGKMLRLDVDGDDAYPGDPLRNYAIPAGNPLVGFAGADEIWALGLRNPFRFTFDRATGDAYLGDVGQDDWEEVNLLPAGAVTAGAPVNFGWPCREGFDPSGCADPPQGCAVAFTDPVRAEPNAGEGGSWRSIMGGFRYRGSRVLPELDGRYLYGDAGNGEIWSATAGAPVPWPASRVTTGIGPYGFGEDEQGELYVLSAWNGQLMCVRRTGDDCSQWATLEVFLADGFEGGSTGAWSGSGP